MSCLTRQNSGDLATIKAQVFHLQGDMILANAALNNHGIRLDQLTRDVTALRNDVTALRRGQEEINLRLDRVEQNIDLIQQNINQMAQNITAILAAVAPGNPPPA